VFNQIECFDGFLFNQIENLYILKKIYYFMLTVEQLKVILSGQREAILRKNFGVEREILGEVSRKKDMPHVIVIAGMRRTGKSTLLRQIIKKHYSDSEFYYVNFEDERLFNFPASEFNRVYEALVELFGKKKAFFVDEIQNVRNFESFVRRFSDDGFKFYITGSNANLLSREIGTKLTGRHLDIIVRPFSFSEFLSLRGVKVEKNSIYLTEKRAELKRHFGEYLVLGGMPEYLAYMDPEILSRIYEDTVIKDIAVRYGVEDVSGLKELYQYLITNFACPFSFNSLRNFLKSGSVNTLRRHTEYLEETYFVKVIGRFDFSSKKQVISPKKLYVCDNGFISAISRKVTPDYGRLLENLVFNNLLSKGDVFYYEGSRECDFVVVESREVLGAVQVCHELSQTDREREIAGLEEAMGRLGLKRGLILTYGQEEEIKYGKKTIEVKPVWKWLLEKEVLIK